MKKTFMSDIASKVQSQTDQTDGLIGSYGFRNIP